MRLVRLMIGIAALGAATVLPVTANAVEPGPASPSAAQQTQSQPEQQMQHQPANLDAGVLESPPGRYCNINPPTGTVCLYAHHNAVGWSAHYAKCGNADIPSWLDPGNPNNNGVSSYWDEQTGGAYLVGYNNNTPVFDTKNKHHTVNLVNGNDKAWWVRVC
ncbi:hypothetical protein [Kribbella solani]|uniref:Peptidase inhibitor family I36 n=1 Tax=Kribbella solani TaxID=236067 RepID=A0A841DE15_9ACTN|nr:hypothetical protein [Kribbella solani]MBB5977314.1 hypothetical protein [Kribbella solani]